MAEMSLNTMRVAVDYALAPTTLGLAVVACTGRGICWLALGDDGDALLAAMLRRWPGGQPVASHVVPLAQAFEAIERPGVAADLALDLRGTAFQLAVWAQLQRIPAGSVISYAELANRVGRPRAYRAVAQACGANPVGVLVPCHRVIASDGGLGGFGFGLARKRELLRREGVTLQTARGQTSAPDPR